MNMSNINDEKCEMNEEEIDFTYVDLDFIPSDDKLDYIAVLRYGNGMDDWLSLEHYGYYWALTRKELEEK